MRMDDLVTDVASEVVDGDKAQIGIILLMVIEAIISELVSMFFSRFINKEEAAKEFISYYNNMGPIRRITWAWKVRSMLKSHPDTGVPSDKLANKLAGKFRNLTVDDVMALAAKQ